MLELSKRVDEAHKKRNTDNEKKNNMPKMLFEIIKMKVNPDQYIRKVVRTNTPILEYSKKSSRHHQFHLLTDYVMSFD